MKRRRYIYLVISTISMCLYGLGYVLPVFATSLEEAFHCTARESSSVFTICLVVFSLGCLASGYLYGIIKIKPLLLLSTIMIGLGILLTAKAQSIETCYLTFGVMFGFGSGIGYKALLTTMLSWFPENPGMIGGIMFMGTGLTAMVFNVPLNSWIEAFGWRNAFITLGCICIVVLMLNLIIVRPHPNDPFSPANDPGQSRRKEDASGFTTKQMLHTSRFWIFFLWCVMISSICMSVASNSVACALSFGISTAEAAFYSGLIAFFNSFSRIFYGFIYDKKGRKSAMAISMVFLTISIITIVLALDTVNSTLLVTGYILLGLCFGAVHPISSAYTLHTFGQKFYSANYSIQGLFTLVGSFTGPFIIGNLYAISNSYYDTYQLLIIYCLTAIILFTIINRIFADLNLKHEV